MSKKTGVICIMTGAALMLSALLFVIYNGREDALAGAESGLALEQIRSAIGGQIQENRQDQADADLIGDLDSAGLGDKECVSKTAADESPAEESFSAEMPTAVIDGYEYIGYLTIPELELDLPVMAQWDYQRLKKAPCRQSGTTMTDDLVIAAHNYKKHFGRLSKLEIGATITFTDMEGTENVYLLSELVQLEPDAVDVVFDEAYDLVLYTCTPGGKSRVAALCKRTEEE